MNYVKRMKQIVCYIAFAEIKMFFPKSLTRKNNNIGGNFCFVTYFIRWLNKWISSKIAILAFQLERINV